MFLVFLLSALIRGPVGFSIDFTGVENFAAWGYFFLYPKLYITFYTLSHLSELDQIAQASPRRPIFSIVGRLAS